MTTLAVDPIFESWPLMVGMAIVLLGVPFLVRIHGDEVTDSRRRTLIALRLASAVLLLLAALRPAFLTTDSQPTRATLAVLIDGSRSMTLPADGQVDGDKTRWQVQQQMWQTLAPALGELDESLDLRVLAYSDRATEVSPAELDAAATDSPQLTPGGNATDLAAALSSALRTAAGQPLAGVVLMGDGVHNPPRNNRAGSNDGAIAAETADQTNVAASSGDPQNAARTLAALDVPIWTIPIGPPGDADQIRDVEIDELTESLSVFAGNDFDLDFVVRTRALMGVEVPVRVWLTNEASPQQREEVAIRRVTAERSADSRAMKITLTAPQAGSYRIEVAAERQDGETFLANNSQYAFVDVRSGGGRVLYLEGQPRPEQTFIRRSLRRFPDLEITYRWISQDTSAQWPIDLGDLLKPGKFDVYIIGDLPAAAIGEKQWELIATAVDGGTGLVAIGGLQAFGAGGYGASPLARVLPIQMTNQPAGDSQIAGDIRPKLTVVHPITSLSSTDASLAAQQSAWDKLPPLVGANRLGQPRVAPGISVLLQAPGESPLLVVGEYGGGRVAAFGGDSTWRWWRRGDDESHRRFWRQMILWLLNRDDDSSVDIAIDLSQRRFETGDQATWRVTHSAADDAKINIQIVAADGTATDISSDLVVKESAAAGVDGEARSALQGTVPALPAGIYRLRATLASSNQAAEKTFQVLDNDRELARPFADLTYMNQLSAQTTASGGASYMPSQIQELIDRIAELRRTSSSPVVEKYRLGDTAATAWPLFLAILILISTEWILRRRWGLV